jgi:thiol-disulfide isomerase/thioredoxin
VKMSHRREVSNSSSTERMRAVHRLLICLFVLGAAAERLNAQEPAPARADSTSETFETIKKEYKDASTAFIAERRAKGNPGGTINMSEGPYPRFAARFLAFAQKHPEDPAALEAVNLALRTSFSSGDKGKEIWAKTVDLLKKKFVTNGDIKKVFLWISVNSHDKASEELLYEVIARNPDRDAQGEACQTLVKRVKRDGEIGSRLREDSDARKRYEERMGNAAVEQLLAKADSAQKAADELADTFRDRFGEYFPKITIGKSAPELISHDVNGTTVRLSDLKGKVVVLDVWTTWCGPCKEMIPHEREMVDRLKDKPFALVSVCCDEEKKALTDFLAKEPMPWTHWWNGQVGGMMSAWNITYFPTIYILDTKGVIRFKDLHGEELEKAVKRLLEEAAVKTAG